MDSNKTDSPLDELLRARYSSSEWAAWESANAEVQQRQQDRDAAVIAGKESPIYHFDHNVMLDGDVELSPTGMSVGGRSVDLQLVSPYSDMSLAD